MSDFCDFDIGCSNVHVLVSTNGHSFRLTSCESKFNLVASKKYKIRFFLKTNVDNVGSRLIVLLSVVGNFFSFRR